MYAYMSIRDPKGHVFGTFVWRGAHFSNQTESGKCGKHDIDTLTGLDGAGFTSVIKQHVSEEIPMSYHVSIAFHGFITAGWNTATVGPGPWFQGLAFHS
jgi:hypothetical protein